MKTFRMNINKVFLDNIKTKDKIHEYRLANEKRRSVKVGDLINLTLKDMTDFALVKVTGVHIYSSWSEAFDNTPNYLNDFKNVAGSKDEALKCCDFYLEEDVSKYGIIVFDIELI